MRMKLQLSKPARMTPRELPGVQVGDDYVSVEYASQAGRFNWYLDKSDGDNYSGMTPPVPARYENGVHLQAALGSILYCMAQSVQPEQGIVNLMRFPFGVSRWAAQHHRELMVVINEINLLMHNGQCFVVEPKEIERAPDVRMHPCSNGNRDCE